MNHSATDKEGPPNSVNAGLSPAERALQRELEERGPGGVDYLEQRRRNLTEIGDSLVARGVARRLAAGRLVAAEAVARGRRAVERGLAEGTGELHVREVARLLGVSRGAARALADALIEDGVLEERGPTVVAAAGGPVSPTGRRGTSAGGPASSRGGDA